MINQQKIRELKEKISECRDYISSDFCKNCARMYDLIHKYELEIEQLEKESFDSNG